MTHNYPFKVVSRAHLESILSLTREHLGLLQEMKEEAVKILKKMVESSLPKADINEENILLGFHCPPFNSRAHLHLHALFPEDSMTNGQKRRIQKSRGWTPINNLIQMLQSSTRL